MRLSKVLPFAAILALLVLLATNLGAGAAGNTGTHYVSIPKGSLASATALGLDPEIAFDYGSYHWLVLSESDFNKLAASGVNYTYVPEAGTVQINDFRFDPLAEGEPRLPEGMRDSDSGPGFRLVQFYGPTNDDWLASLEASGAHVLQYYPHYAFLVWGTEAQVDAAASNTAIRWHGPVHPGYKMNGELLGRSGRVRNVDIFFYNDGNIQGTLDAITALGGNVLQAFPAQPDKAFYDAVVEFDAAQFDSLAQINTVLWFGYLGPNPILDDEMSSQIVAGNYTGGVPFVGYFDYLNDLGFDGSGVTWAVIDTGVDYDHPDLGPRIVGGRDFPGACVTGNPGEDCPAGGHGTHVAGIIGGDATAGYTDGDSFLYGLGVAPNYSIFTTNSLSGGPWPPAGGWQEHSKWSILGGAIGGNNSWTTGEGTNHGYQASERTHDIMVLDGNFDTVDVAEPFIEVFSAGNSGPGGSTLTAPKEAKNLIVTASSLNYRAGNIDGISNSSSRGPAVDGRWVPTIAAPGNTIASTRNDTGGLCATPIGGTDNLYAFCSGTSMAAPHAAGAIVLATEWWRSFNGGDDPSSAMAKALLVNNAIDMAAADIPNIHEGWGRINVTNIISPVVPTLYYDQPVIFGNSGEQWVINGGVIDPTKPFKVTLAWADAPGAVGANPALVNNLDLTVTVDGDTYLGNVFSGGWSNTGGSADTINNLENVFVQNASGSFQVVVDAVNISGDAVLYNGDTTDQGFALVCQNCALVQDFSLVATPSTQDICVGDMALYDVEVASILGFSDPVTLSASDHPAGTTASFSVNPVVPPGTSELTIGNTAGATVGNYTISVVGVAPTSTHTTTVQLNVFDTAATVSLVSPADGTVDTPIDPTFEWSGTGTSYTIEIATDAAFNDIVETDTVMGTTYTSAGLDPETTYYWRVTANNVCGGGTSETWSFTTKPVPPILLVDDDDNSPNVQATYTAALDALGLDYDVWDTNNTDNEPNAAQLSPYEVVIWFTGDEFGGAAGPGGDGEAALGQWLDAGNCLFISSQDYYYDRGKTTFMDTYLGVNTATSDVTQTTVTGAGSVFSGLGPFTLSYLFNNYSDMINPDGAPAELAFSGNAGNAAVNKDGGNYRTTFWGFPWEAINTAANREAALQTFLDWCGELPAYDVNLSGNQSAEGQPGETVEYTVTVTNNGNVTDTVDLTVSGETWTTSLSVSSVELGAGESVDITVSVEIPGDALPGDSDMATVTGTSAGDPAESDSMNVATSVPQTYGVEVTGDSSGSGAPGAVVPYDVTITNTGDGSDTFDLTTSGNTWTATLSENSVTLGAGESAVVTVEVNIPGDAADGDMDTVTVTATSTGDPGVSDSHGITTTASTAPSNFPTYLPIMLKP